MALRARVLYDFTSENPGELSVKESEVLTLYSEQDIEGWLEGANSRGERGLFPASYVEILRSDNSCRTSADTFADSRYSNAKPSGFDGTFQQPPVEVDTL